VQDRCVTAASRQGDGCAHLNNNPPPAPFAACAMRSGRFFCCRGSTARGSHHQHPLCGQSHGPILTPPPAQLEQPFLLPASYIRSLNTVILLYPISSTITTTTTTTTTTTAPTITTKIAEHEPKRQLSAALPRHGQAPEVIHSKAHRQV